MGRRGDPRGAAYRHLRPSNVEQLHRVENKPELLIMQGPSAEKREAAGRAGPLTGRSRTHRASAPTRCSQITRKGRFRSAVGVLKLPTYEPTERHSGGASPAAALRELWRRVQQLRAAATAGVARRVVDCPLLAVCVTARGRCVYMACVRGRLRYLRTPETVCFPFMVSEHRDTRLADVELGHIDDHRGSRLEPASRECACDAQYPAHTRLVIDRL